MEEMKVALLWNQLSFHEPVGKDVIWSKKVHNASK